MSFPTVLLCSHFNPASSSLDCKTIKKKPSNTTKALLGNVGEAQSLSKLIRFFCCAAQKDNFVECLKLLKKGEAICLQAKNKPILAITLNNIACYYRRRSQPKVVDVHTLPCSLHPWM